MARGLDIVFLGLTLSSSWGNGHATTYRALLSGLAEEGHSALFLERSVPWYSGDRRDLTHPDYCDLAFYESIDPMLATHGERLRRADAVIVGSYVPEGALLIDKLAAMSLDRLCFYDIDTPVTLEMLETGQEDHLARRQVARFGTYFSFAGGKALEILRTRHGARDPRPLHCAVDPRAYRPSGAAIRWDLGYLGTYSPDRQSGLERLLIEPARRLPEFRFVVAGAQYPDDIDWPGNVERIEHVPPAAHSDFYSAQRFTLNLTRTAMRRLGWSPSVRLFEAAACGTPILSDRWPGLDDILPEGRALLSAATTEDAVGILTGTDDIRRREIAKAARDRVLAAHTGRARARELVAALTGIRHAA